MKLLNTILSGALTTAIMVTTPTAHSRDTTVMISVPQAMQTEAFKAKLDPSVRFYFGAQKHPSINKNFGNFVTNKKTNAFNKSDEDACRHVFLSTLLSLQDRVKKEGGNAVVNIKSYYKANEQSHNNKVECHAGAIIAGVALKGDVVKLAK